RERKQCRRRAVGRRAAAARVETVTVELTTGRDALAADADVAVRTAQAAVVLVDHTVAVVVVTVAGLDGRLGRGALTPRTVGAGLGALTARGRARALDVLVDLAVAVVVDAVADLGGGRAG